LFITNSSDVGEYIDERARLPSIGRQTWFGSAANRTLTMVGKPQFDPEAVFVAMSFSPAALLVAVS
jgi:hypothetical protein